MPKGQKPKTGLVIIIGALAGMALPQAEEALEVGKEILRQRRAATTGGGKPGPKAGAKTTVAGANAAVDKATASATGASGVSLVPPKAGAKKSHHKKKDTGATGPVAVQKADEATASTIPGTEGLDPEVAAIVAGTGSTGS